MKPKNTEQKKISLQNQIKKLKKAEHKFEDDHIKMQNEIIGMNKEIISKNNLLNRIFSHSQVLIAYLDPNFNFIQVNNSYADFYKKSIKYFIGKNYFTLYPYEEYKNIFMQVVETGKPYLVSEKQFHQNINNEKNDLFWEWSLYPFKNEAGEVDGLILTLLDVTNRVKDKKEIAKIKKKLTQSNRMSDLGLLAATVAHELKNPLSVILAALYNIDRKKESIPITNQIQTIEKKIMESEQIISNLLTYAKIKTPNLTKVDILQLLEESISTVSMIVSNENIKIVKNINGNFNNFIKIDAYQMKEVFNNLLLNAFQAVNKKIGIIKISAKTVDDSMELVITDNGSGIKKSDLVKVFKPFFTRKSRGTGLGLSLCREIIALHNGCITIESKLDKETKVYIKLPY